MSEAELAKRVMDWLTAQGWDCYPEVMYDFSRADIVAMRGALLMVVECKTRSNMALWGQAVSWRWHAQFICVAHRERARPESSGARLIEKHLCRYFGIGRILVDDYHVWEDVMPGYRRPDTVCYRNLKKALHEDQKNYAPGTQAGYSTPWRRTMKRAIAFVKKNQGCTIRKVIECIDHHYSRDSTARACVAKWLALEKGIVTRHIEKEIRYFCRIERR